MIDLRKALSEISYLPTGTEPGEDSPWIAAASVLAQFDPLTLNSTAGLVDPSSPAMTDLLEASVASLAERKARRLKSGIRRRALQRLHTSDAMRAALALNTGPDTPTQAAFAAILEGPVAVQALLDVDDPVVLAGLTEALGWVDGILPGLPPAERASERLARARLVAPLRKLVGSHFAGREDILKQISDHLALAPPDQILMLQGPGGVGKSTVLAKFILDALDKTEHAPTVIWLNLDNPELVIDDPFTLLQEAGRQLRAQHPKLGGRLDELRNVIASLQRRSRSVAELESVAGGAVDWNAVRSIASEVVAAVPDTSAILLVIDTFEEAQFTGHSAVQRLLQLVHSLQDGNPRLKVVIAGRVAEPMFQERALPITALEPVSARAVLEKVSGMPTLPDALVDQIYRITEGNPLATHLAGRVLATEGADAFGAGTDFTDLLGQIRTEQVQARLYGRVLGHIHDDEIRRLAYPGLTVRRITPEVLYDVLAGPCRVNVPDLAEAYRLFGLFEREVALVERDPQDGALRHRADVRRIMLRDLRADQPDLTTEIDEAAIIHYRGQSGLIARAEEIYHMLAHGVSAAEVDARWELGLEPYLAPALEELPPVAQVYLSSKLRLDLRPELQAAADQDSWEAITEQTTRALMRDGLAEQALGVLHQRCARKAGSKLYLTEAEVLHMLGRRRQALVLLVEAKKSAVQAGERVLLVRLGLLGALMHEGAGSLAKAAVEAKAAFDIAELTQNAMVRLRCIVALLRLHRKVRNMPGPAPAALVFAAEGLIEDVGQSALFDTPGLLRDLAAELGMRNPRLLATALSVTGSYVELPPIAVQHVKAVSGAAGLVSDPRAKAYLLEHPVTLSGRLDAMTLINAVQAPEARFAATVLVTDLLTLETDAARGRLASRTMQSLRKPWRESDAVDGKAGWDAKLREAF